MQGTIVCGVGTGAESHAAAQLAAALAARLGLRLVLVHIATGGGRDRDAAAEQRGQECVGPELEAIAREHCEDAEIRILAHNRVDGLAQVAAEEGADVIVVGSSPHGMRGRRLRCTLARELEAATDVPVLIAPPETRARSRHRLALARAAAER